MSDPLYAKDLLRLAAMAAGAGTLVPSDAVGHAFNPSCGDRVDVTLRLDAGGQIAEFAHETKACVLAQASASILGMRLAGVSEDGVKELRGEVLHMLKEGAIPPPPFGEYAALAGAATFRSRHSCVLLPIDAVLDAFARAGKR